VSLGSRAGHNRKLADSTSPLSLRTKLLIGIRTKVPLITTPLNSGQHWRFDSLRAPALRPFGEAGIGVRLLSHPSISKIYTLSNALQFANIVSVGPRFGSKQQLQSRFTLQQLSNQASRNSTPASTSARFTPSKILKHLCSSLAI